MARVGAMSIHSALHREPLASAPLSILMTGTTKQIMLDVADRIFGVPADQKVSVDARLGKISLAV